MWVLQTNLIDIHQVTDVVNALKSISAHYTDVSVIPFSDEFVTPLELTHTNIIPYGSTKLCKIAERRGWLGLFFDRSTFRVDAWNKQRTDMLNGDAETMTVKEAMGVFETRDPDSVWFIRPIEDLKQFNGTVTTAKEIAHWMSSVESGNFSFDESTVVSVASPKQLLAEWRYFVVNRKVVSGSLYRMRGLKLTRRETDREVLEEAQRFADKWLPHETCVMDLALTPDGVKVIEFNCLNSSGFYYHDVGAIVSAVDQYFNKKAVQ